MILFCSPTLRGKYEVEGDTVPLYKDILDLAPVCFVNVGTRSNENNKLCVFATIVAFRTYSQIPKQLDLLVVLIRMFLRDLRFKSIVF